MQLTHFAKKKHVWQGATPQTQRWMYIHILALLSLGGCSADSIYSIYSNGFACFSPFTANVFLTSLPWVVTDFYSFQNSTKINSQRLETSFTISRTTWLIFIFLVSLSYCCMVMLLQAESILSFSLVHWSPCQSAHDILEQFRALKATF